jgi:hypothetical protein
MIDDKIITEFIPAVVLEHPVNTYPEASFNDKVKMAMRRFLSSDDFTGDIVEEAPRLMIIKSYFNPNKMGYDVIARIL